MSVFYYALSLAALGLIEWACRAFGDANLPPLYPQTRLCINLLFLNLAAAYALLLKDPPKLDRRAWLLLAAVGFGLCAMGPVFSGDLHEYLVRGRIVALYHESPYRHTPAEYPQDLFYSLSTWKDNPDSYGPLFVWIEAVPAFLAPHSVRAMVWIEKTIFLGFMAAAAFYFHRIVRLGKFGNGALLLCLFAFNPLWIVSSLVDGHNDVVMVAFTVASAAFFLERRYTAAFLLWTCAFLVKYTVLLVLPPLVFLAVRDEWGRAGAFPWKFVLGQSALNAALIAACFAPLWDGADTFLALIRASVWFYSNTLPYAFREMLGRIGVGVDAQLLKMALMAGFWLVYAEILRRVLRLPAGDAQGLARHLCAIYLFFYLTVTIPFGAHYLLWALPWLVLSRWPAEKFLVTVYSFVGLFAYFKRINYLILLGAVLYSGALLIEKLRRPAGGKTA